MVDNNVVDDNLLYKFRRENPNNVDIKIIDFEFVKPTDSILNSLMIDTVDRDDCKIVSCKVLIGESSFITYFVIGNDESVFNDEVIKNSNLSEIEETEYNECERNYEFEKYVIRSLEALSKVTPSLLKFISRYYAPTIIFKYSAFDSVFFPKGAAAYAYNSIRSVVCFTDFPTEYNSIVHEFGHILDYELGLTQFDPPTIDGVLPFNTDELSEQWDKLSKKYCSALRNTTIGGCRLSGYDTDDYKNDYSEYFADLFSAFYLGDKSKDGPYLVEYLNSDALSFMELIIEYIQLYMEDNKSRKIYDDISQSVGQLYFFDVNKLFEMRKFFDEYRDIEVLRLVSKLIKKEDFFDRLDEKSFYTLNLLIENFNKYVSTGSDDNRNKIISLLSQLNDYEIVVKKANTENKIEDNSKIYDINSLIDVYERLKKICTREDILNRINNLIEEYKDNSFDFLLFSNNKRLSSFFKLCNEYISCKDSLSEEEEDKYLFYINNRICFMLNDFLFNKKIGNDEKFIDSHVIFDRIDELQNKFDSIKLQLSLDSVVEIQNLIQSIKNDLFNEKSFSNFDLKIIMSRIKNLSERIDYELKPISFFNSMNDKMKNLLIKNKLNISRFKNSLDANNLFYLESFNSLLERIIEWLSCFNDNSFQQFSNSIDVIDLMNNLYDGLALFIDKNLSGVVLYDTNSLAKEYEKFDLQFNNIINKIPLDNNIKRYFV